MNNNVSRRHWLGAAALASAAAVTGTANAQTKPTADDLIRTVKGTRVFDLSFTWNDQAPPSRNEPRSIARASDRCQSALRSAMALVPYGAMFFCSTAKLPGSGSSATSVASG